MEFLQGRIKETLHIVLQFLEHIHAEIKHLRIILAVGIIFFLRFHKRPKEKEILGLLPLLNLKF